MRIGRVLIANRGEIAVRVARACRDLGIASVAVYADQDLDAPHARAADEAYSLAGDTAAETYLSVGKLLETARRAGADAVHPGYGFLAENAEFAAAVIDAGLTWIGPPPDAIAVFGDKTAARKLARRVGAPMAAGTTGPVRDAEEIIEFARRNGLPVLIKAAYGGGGRGLRVARTMAEIPELHESAAREATAAFGRGECFAERYLDRARHVETQCLADVHGNVVVVSTRDCTLQRRHQKLVEEAPAPFLSDRQRQVLYASSKALLAEAGYAGAGTCEFLVGADGTISFLEVNARLQVEHPVTEEVTGIDLVCEQIRIACGEPLGYGDPPARGHSIEFRINGEDPGLGFVPVPGTVTRWRPPSGPGVRVDSGVEEGSVVSAAFDSMLAKLVVSGATREQALARARRALAEYEVEGLATVLPFHRAVAADPAFAGDGFAVHTRWIETEFGGAGSAPAGAAVPGPDGGTGTDSPAERRRVTVEVDGRRLEIGLPSGYGPAGRGSGRARPQAGRRPRRTGTGSGTSTGTLVSPMQATVLKVAVAAGQWVEAGDQVAVLEAMKMEQPVTAHRSGRVTGLFVEAGAAVARGQALCEISSRAPADGRRASDTPGGDHR